MLKGLIAIQQPGFCIHHFVTPFHNAIFLSSFQLLAASHAIFCPGMGFITPNSKGLCLRVKADTRLGLKIC